jgi:uncharacterized protein (DUF927 family)
LDEFKEISEKEAGGAAYLLANGSGKTRANRSGAARRATSWKLFFLSSGEIGLSEHMRRAGERANAGHEVRLVEIDIGDFEDLHGYGTPGQFADALRENAGKYYGAAGMEFLRQLVEKRAELAGNIRECIDNFVSGVVPADASGQVSRVARRFALVAVAGELATNSNLTGWSEGTAIKAAQICFESWLENFGTGDRETAHVLSQVRLFFELHGASRFQDAGSNGTDHKTINRAGFYQVEGVGADQKKTYLVLPEVLKSEILNGLNFKLALNVLTEAGWLKPGSDDRPTQKPRICAMSNIPTRVYVFNDAWANTDTTGETTSC